MNFTLSTPLTARSVTACFVQPVQSPYWTERLRALAQNADLELTLLLERDALAHRPGWQPEHINRVEVHVLGSAVICTTIKGDDLGYRIRGIRSVPWRLTAELLRRKPDVVLLCNASQVIFALPLKYFYRKRLVLIVEDTPHATRNLAWLPRQVKRWLYNRVDSHFAFSADAEDFLHRLGIKKGIQRTSWSLDMNLFQPSPKESARNHAPKVCRKVIFVGALVNNKGVKQLLDAWRALPADIRKASELLLVGSGPLRQEIEDFIQTQGVDEAKLLGQVPYLEVKRLLQQSDLLVLPTLQDLFSLTVLEAMACGCPVITTPFNGARELVEHGQNGWVVDPTQPGALAAALRRALSEESDLTGMGLAARKRVEKMDNATVMARFAESLRNLVSDAVQ